MTAKGESPPIAPLRAGRSGGRPSPFFFVKILKARRLPRARRRGGVLSHNALPISSFMISFVPP